jgi:hypothetical protein
MLSYGHSGILDQPTKREGLSRPGTQWWNSSKTLWIELAYCQGGWGMKSFWLYSNKTESLNILYNLSTIFCGRYIFILWQYYLNISFLFILSIQVLKTDIFLPKIHIWSPNSQYDYIWRRSLKRDNYG